MRVELHPEADAEFAAQIEYYEGAEPGLGLRFYREVIGYGLDCGSPNASKITQ